METTAKHRQANISPQKCRLVTDLIRGKDVAAALDVLKFCRKKAAPLVAKVVYSAMANAEHNHGADIDELCISQIFVDEGPVQKRWQPRARGRSDRLTKRTCHITVKVAEKGEI